MVSCSESLVVVCRVVSDEALSGFLFFFAHVFVFEGVVVLFVAPVVIHASTLAEEMNLVKKLSLGPPTTHPHLSLDLVGWKCEGVFDDRDPAGLDAKPQVELRSLDHPQEGCSLVLELTAFFARLASGSGWVVNHSDSGVAFVLVLTTLAARPEGLDLAVVDGHTQDASFRPWLSSSTSHDITVPVRAAAH